MNKEYFKNLNNYNSGVKLTSNDMLLRLSKRITDTYPEIGSINIINYVIKDNKYLTLFEKEIDILGELKTIKALEVVSL